MVVEGVKHSLCASVVLLTDRIPRTSKVDFKVTPITARNVDLVDTFSKSSPSRVCPRGVWLIANPLTIQHLPGSSFCHPAPSRLQQSGIKIYKQGRWHARPILYNAGRAAEQNKPSTPIASRSVAVDPSTASDVE